MGRPLPIDVRMSRKLLRRLCYPFEVLVNDQFDRFSAPIERRYTRARVETMLEAAGLDDVTVLPNHGWLGEGRVPEGGGTEP